MVTWLEMVGRMSGYGLGTPLYLDVLPTAIIYLSFHCNSYIRCLEIHVDQGGVKIPRKYDMKSAALQTTAWYVTESYASQQLLLTSFKNVKKIPF
jgi:hypothetical protein